MRIEVEEGARGQRLDKFVADHFGLSRAAAQKKIVGATLDGGEVKASLALRGGEILVLSEAVEAEEPPPVLPSAEEAPPLKVVFEDDDLLVLDKPRGLVVHAGAGETGATLVEILRAQGRTLSTSGPEDRAGIVHRLDKDTTGVMVVAKTDAAHEVLARAFEERRVQKTYLALVCGLPRSPGRIEAPIARHSGNRLKMAVAPHGKSAITLYRVIKTWEKFALCEVDLLSGRTHQIRAHFQFLGHAVAADALYAGYKRALETAPSEEVREALEALGGQALHAWTLGFDHPVTGEPMRFEVPLDAKFQAVLEALDAASE